MRDLPAWIQTIISAGGVVVGALLATLLLRRAVSRFVRRYAEEGDMPAEPSMRARTIGMVLRTFLTTGVWVLAVLLALSQAGFDIGPLLATAGVGGVAIGIGGQHLVRDIISGIAIVFEDQYRVGDVVEILGVSGRVEKIRLRSTTLRDVHGTVHTLANGDIRHAANMTKEFSRYVIDLPLPYDQDVDLAIELSRQELEKMRSDPHYAHVIRAPLSVLGVDDYEASSAIVKMYVETLPGRQWGVGRELRRRIFEGVRRARHLDPRRVRGGANARRVQRDAHRHR